MKRSIILIIFIILNLLNCGRSKSQIQMIYYIHSNGAQLPLWTRGSNSKKIIIFLHGGPGSSCLYIDGLPFYEELSKSYMIVYWDQRGAGGSSGDIPPISITIPQMVQDVDAIYTFIKEKYPDSDIYIMGHSFGGMIGAAYLSQYNDKVKASIFLCPAFSLLDVRIDAPPLCEAFAKKYGNTQIEEFYKNNSVLSAKVFSYHYEYVGWIDKMNSIDNKIEENRARLANFHKDHPIQINPFVQKNKQLQVVYDLEGNGEGNRDLTTDDIYNVKNITNPVLVLVGEKDYLVPNSVSYKGFEAMNGNYPNSRSEYHILENSSHYVTESEQALSLDIVLQFMEKN